MQTVLKCVIHQDWSVLFHNLIPLKLYSYQSLSNTRRSSFRIYVTQTEVDWRLALGKTSRVAVMLKPKSNSKVLRINITFHASRSAILAAFECMLITILTVGSKMIACSWRWFGVDVLSCGGSSQQGRTSWISHRPNKILILLSTCFARPTHICIVYIQVLNSPRQRTQVYTRSDWRSDCLHVHSLDVSAQTGWIAWVGHTDNTSMFVALRQRGDNLCNKADAVTFWFCLDH